MSYRYDKLVKFASWVGIVPDNWLESKPLFYFCFHFWWEIEDQFEEIFKCQMEISYRYDKLFKFPSCVGIVPENWLEARPLFHFGFGLWWKIED